MGYDPTQGTIGNFGGNPSGIWRNFNNSRKADFCDLGNIPGFYDNPQNTYSNIDAPMHHGVQWCPEAISGQWDGVNFMFIPGSNNNGFTFHQHDGSLIPASGNVWRVRKGLGKWGEFADNLTSGTHLLYPNGLLPAPETRCGTMPQNGMIYGSALLDIWNPILEPLTEQEVNGVMLTNPLVCQQMAAGSGGSGGPTIYNWRKEFVRSVNYTGYVWSKYNKPVTGGGHGFIFEMLNEIQNINLVDYNGTNSTGISWWPGDDVAMVQLYKVDHNTETRMDEPITLMPSTLIDANGNLVPLNFTLHKGLYNVVFLDHDNNTFRFMFELENDTQHTLNESDMVNVNIFPNPFDSSTGQVSTTIESLINCRYNYTIVDANNQLYHQQHGQLKANDKTELIIKAQILPSGQLFHKFVFSDGSVKILQTLKD